MKHMRLQPLGSARKRPLIIVLIVVGLLLAGGGVYAYTSRHASPHPKTASASASTTPAPAKAAPVSQAVMIRLPGADPVVARVADYSLDSDIWTLVNKQRPLSSTDYAPDPIVIPDVPTRTDKSVGERSVRADIAGAVKQLFEGAKSAGYDLVLASGYRSAAVQKQYFDAYAASDGEAAANRYSAHPGQSEHQTGLAFDVTTESRVCYLVECFGDTPEAMWIAAHAHEYGFIVRYPKGKEAITGYEYEPWHLRYLGTDLATAVYKSGLTYEEVWPYLVKADDSLRADGQLKN